ncbi:MAG: MBOAT family protein, partial [Epsilonproteobacteria bacterium]
TFNFINIAWVFFRAKEWDDAVKVLGSMFSLDNIVLPNMLESRLPFLSDLGIKFGGFIANIQGDYFTPVWLVIGLIFILLFKNSTQKLNNFKLNYKSALLTTITLVGGILSLNKVSEFLYFNF